MQRADWIALARDKTMADEPEKKIGRPKKAAHEKSDRRLVAKVTSLEGEGFDWMLGRAKARVAGDGGKVTESSLLRNIVKEEIKRRGWPRAHLLDAQGAIEATPESTVEPHATTSPEKHHEARAVDVPELDAPAAASVPPAAEPEPARLPAVLVPPPSEPTRAAPVKLTQAGVRKLMERCMENGLHVNEIVTRSGIDKAKLYHFKGGTSDRSELKPAKLEALHGALRRWEEEQKEGDE